MVPAVRRRFLAAPVGRCNMRRPAVGPQRRRSEEHTSELQSQSNLVCRLLLEKKKYTTARTVAAHRSRSTSNTRTHTADKLAIVAPYMPFHSGILASSDTPEARQTVSKAIVTD